MTDNILRDINRIENNNPDGEKPLDTHTIEQLERTLDESDALFVASFPEEERKKIVRKIDVRLVPVLASLYLLSYLDRSNIANAEIEGMLQGLGMSGIQYNVATSLFFVTYILFEIPSNWVLERYFAYRPSLYVGGITFCWGVMMTLHGVVHSFGGLLALRLIMGAFEAGFFPAAVLLMNKWYIKFELSSRVSVYYAGAAIAGAFSGLLAYALVKMDGVGGLAGWRWIFIMEGLVTLVVGILVMIFLINSPERPCSWLTTEQRRYCELRLIAQDGGAKVHAAGKKFSWKLLWEVVKDWQFYPMSFVFWSNTIPGYGLKFTMPQIIKNMGFTSNNAQLMTIPPYFCGAISAYAFGRLSDRFKRRSYFLIIPQLCLVVAFAILTALSPHSKKHVGACYFGVILACIGLYPIQPGSSSWISNNLAGPAKRAIGLAYAFSLTNVGSVGGSYIYIASEAPSYPTGFGCSLAFALAAILAVGILEFGYMRINKKRDMISEDEVRSTYTDEDLAALGDRSPLFRYIL